jgi:serine/threonine protein kinase
MYQILKGLVYLHDKSISHRGKRGRILIMAPYPLTYRVLQT